MVLLAVGCSGQIDEKPAPEGEVGDDVRVEGSMAGDCSDEADNDLDGLFDCDDDGCTGSPACGEDTGTLPSDADADADADGDISVLPPSELSYSELSVPGDLQDHDIAADGSTRVLTKVGDTLNLHCFTPSGTDTRGAIAIGSAGTPSTSSFAVFTSRLSKHTLVAWRWYSPGGEQFRYSYLDADCNVLVPETTIWTGDYVEFFDVAMDDDGRAVIAYGQGATHVAWIDVDGAVLGTETPFDISATNGTHVAINPSTGAGLVASQIHSGDGIYYQRFSADFEWIDTSPVHMPAGYHYWYDGFTVGMNDYGQFAFLWVSSETTLEMAFYSADGERIAEVERAMPAYGAWDVFRRRHSEVPLHRANFVFGEVYSYAFSVGTEVMHFEYTPDGALVSEDSTSHSINEGLTIRTDGWGNAVVHDGSTVQALYSYP